MKLKKKKEFDSVFEMKNENDFFFFNFLSQIAVAFNFPYKKLQSYLITNK